MEQEALQDAITRREFLRAHEIDERIRAVEERLGEMGMLEAPDADQSEMLRASLKKALGGGFTYLGVVSTLEQPASIDDKRVVASAFGTGAFLLGWFILSFCGSLILNIVDASYWHTELVE